jgi:two-component system, OmpR family, sensor kinase
LRSISSCDPSAPVIRCWYAAFGALPVVTSRADKLAAAYVGGWHPGGLLLVTAWTAAGCAFGVRAVRTRRWLFAWFGLLFVAFACVELLRFATHPVESVWVAGPSAMRLVGLLFGLTGATRELVRTFQDQQGHLLERVESEKTTEARLQAEQRALEERAHEARNALTAIEGATRTLQHYRDQLDEATRESLTEAVTREIARLQQLVSAEQVISTRGRFRLADVVAGIVTAARSRGATVHVDVPGDLVAYGRPAETGQVVQNLVENARRYAPDSPIFLRAVPAPGAVLLRVEDEGPGVPPNEQTAIFRRGHRGSTSRGVDGTGLGLYVSQRLMQEQGGSLSVEERPGGGASFTLRLPTDPSTALPEQVGDEPDDVVERGKVTPLFRKRRTEDAQRVARSRRDNDDDVRRETPR